MSKGADGEQGVARTFQLVGILPSPSLTENVMIPAVFGCKANWGTKAESVFQDALELVGLLERANIIASDLTIVTVEHIIDAVHEPSALSTRTLKTSG